MRKTKIAVWIILTPITAIVLLLGYQLLVNAIDIEPPDTADLEIDEVDVPDEQNAFVYFMEAADQLYWPTNGMSHIEIAEDADLLAAVAQSNRVAFVLVDQGNACDHFQPPAVTSIAYTFPHLQPLLKLGRTLRLKCLHEIETGQIGAASSTALALTRFGWLVQDGSRTVIDYLVGVAIQGMGVASAETLMREQSLTTESLFALSRALASYKPSRQGLQRAFKGEYHFAVMATDEILSGQAGVEDIFLMDRYRGVSFLQRRLLQRNRTLALYAGFFRQMIAQAGKPYKDIERMDASGTVTSPSHLIGLFMGSNPIGRILYQLLVPGLDGVHKRRCHLETQVSCTRVLGACLAYAQETGRWPDTLAQLVPAYLDAIPRDPWDGEPLRYDPDKAIIYAVGIDLLDSGGSTEITDPAYKSATQPVRDHAQDIVFELDSPDAQ